MSSHLKRCRLPKGKDIGLPSINLVGCKIFFFLGGEGSVFLHQHVDPEVQRGKCEKWKKFRWHRVGACPIYSLRVLVLYFSLWNLSVKLMIDSFSMGLKKHSSKKDLTFHSSKYNCLDGDASPFKLVELRPRNRLKLPNLYTADLLQTTLHSWKVGIPSPLEGSYGLRRSPDGFVTVLVPHKNACKIPKHC